MNENEFQEFLEREFPFSYGIGIGDDAAVIDENKQGSQVITKDILIENVHFKLDYFSFEDLAQKSLAVNLSDIAAMGAVPEYFFLGLGLPEKYQKNMNTFFKGIKNTCNQYNIELAGGDYSKSDLAFISITMIGRVNKSILRKNAKIGDYICITKKPGESALGLKLLQNMDFKKADTDESYFIKKHKYVIPELKKGQILLKYVNSMMDISDGLTKDLTRIITASKKGARIIYEKIPISEKFKKICTRYDLKEEELILGGGEDYGLLFTISEKNERLLRKEMISFDIIGEIIEDRSLIIEKNNKVMKNRYSGYDHFLT